jgi:2-(1,2-epoxy-1,2-dihydrophenyl)acetyl-CoA isomerase
VSRELVERLYGALARGDRQAVADLLHPEFVATFSAGLPFGIGGTYQCLDAIDRGWWELGRHFAVRAHPLEWLQCEGGRLLVIGDYAGRARGGHHFEAPFAHLWAFRDDRLVHLIQITDSALWQSALGSESAR